MKILLFTNSLTPGGAERVAVDLANHWAANGTEVTLLTLSTEDRDFYPVHASVRRLGLGVPESGNLIARIFDNARRVWCLRRVLRAERPDVAVALMSTPNVLLALASWRLPGLTAIGSEHNYLPASRLPAQWRWLRARTYALLDGVTALTEESAAWLKRHTRARRVTVIANAIPFPLAHHEPMVVPDNVVPADQPVLLAVGRLVEEKGFDLLIAAFGKLAERFPDWTLVILGEGPQRPALEAQAASSPGSDRIFIPGIVGNVGDWYRFAELYAMSSRNEGFGNSLAEALAHGLPAIAFDCEAGPRHILRHEIDGYLVADGDLDGFISALAKLMDDKGLRDGFARRAVEAKDRFSVARTINKWEKLFEECLTR